MMSLITSLIHMNKLHHLPLESSWVKPACDFQMSQQRNLWFQVNQFKFSDFMNFWVSYRSSFSSLAYMEKHKSLLFPRLFSSNLAQSSLLCNALSCALTFFFTNTLQNTSFLVSRLFQFMFSFLKDFFHILWFWTWLYGTCVDQRGGLIWIDFEFWHYDAN